MKITLIAAFDRNRGIGVGGALPWRMPADLCHFKQATMGKPILMGRKTWESLPGVLPGRPHLVLSRDPGFMAPGATVVHSIAESLEEAVKLGDELMVVGGGQIYRLFLPLADRLLLTEVDTEVPADAWFPQIDAESWEEAGRETHPADDENPHAYAFVAYRRRLACG